MATPGEKLAESLEKLKTLQDSGVVGIKTDDFSRVHRERLIENGFIREVVRGWYIAVPHEERQGDSTSWFTSFWEFCSRYLEDRYGDNYCISAEQSLKMHAGNNAVPHQLIVHSPKGNNMPTKLLFNTSLFAMKSTLPDKVESEMKFGVRILNLPSAIVHSPVTVFQENATDVRTALLLIQDASQLLEILLEGGHSTIAGRLVGAYRNLGQKKIANEILKTMKSAGYDVRETDPFEGNTPIVLDSREKSPYVNRIRLMWYEMRKDIIKVFPKSKGPSPTIDVYLHEMDEIYITDAYHSLSIEKYRVTPALIERVRTGAWDDKQNESDRQQRDAMAARGYWQAFNAVKESVKRILKGENAGDVADNEHGDWFRELFAPSVAVGLLRPSDLAGYRNNQVYIGLSKHTPVNKDGVCDAMPVLFELLRKEEDAGVRAVMGHFIFVFIHPYMDGNGRIGRFLMNTMLASGGYPWTVIPLEERDRYMQALEAASVDQNIKPFAEFVGWLVEKGIEGTPVASNKSILDKFFNCSEQHEIDYVAGLYIDSSRVQELLKKRCADGKIHYSTYLDVFKLIKKELGYDAPV